MRTWLLVCVLGWAACGADDEPGSPGPPDVDAAQQVSSPADAGAPVADAAAAESGDGGEPPYMPPY